MFKNLNCTLYFLLNYIYTVFKAFLKNDIFNCYNMPINKNFNLKYMYLTINFK